MKFVYSHLSSPSILRSCGLIFSLFVFPLPTSQAAALSSTQEERKSASPPVSMQRPIAPYENEVNKIKKANDHYIRATQENTVAQEQAPSTPYIPMRGQPTTSKNNVDLLDHIQTTFLPSERRCLVLLGAPSTGKSTFLFHLVEHLWKQYQQNSSPWIPIYIPLHAVKNPKQRGAIFHNFLKPCVHLEAQSFPLLQEKRKLLFILDEYQTLPFDLQKTGIFRDNAGLCQGQSKLLVASCPYALADIEKPYKLFHSLKKKVSFLDIAPLEKKQIKTYLETYLSNPHSQKSTEQTQHYMHYLTTIKGLYQIASRPAFLVMITRYLPTLALSPSPDTQHNEQKKEEQESQLIEKKLYNALLTHYFTQQFQKETPLRKSLFTSPQDKEKAIQELWYFAKTIAKYLLKANKTSFSKYSSPPASEESDSDEWSDEESEEAQDLSDWEQLFPTDETHTKMLKEWVFQALPTYPGKNHYYSLDEGFIHYLASL